VPVVNGVATCDVTPGTWDDEGTPAPYKWGIRATATFTPADGSPLYSSSGNDATTKITLGPTICWNVDPEYGCGQPQIPFVVVSIEPGSTITLWVAASDSLGRAMSFQWQLYGEAPVTDTPWTTMTVPAGLSVGSLDSVCPAGVAPYSGTFECQYGDTGSYSIELNNEYMG
jgi:hypothetical protein